MLLKKIIGSLNSNSTPRFYSTEQLETVLRRERMRADRNHHDFSMIVFDFGERPISDGKIKKLHEYLKSGLRAIDEIGWFTENQIGIVLPYTKAENASILASKLKIQIEKIAAIQAVHIYAYPSVWPFKLEKNGINVETKPDQQELLAAEINGYQS